MLETIRIILSGKKDRNPLQVIGQLLCSLYFALFISDCINIDVLFASVKGGQVTFIDNPSISDSLFDTGSSHRSVFDAPHHHNDHQKISSKRTVTKDGIVKNVIYEDEDSPGIEDAVLSSAFAVQNEMPRPESEVTFEGIIHTLDRTISYQRILI